ncbi:killer cell lectin-like receptor subfamily B member 1B allele B [Lithobates pipiens]
MKVLLQSVTHTYTGEMDDVEYAKLNHKKRRGKPQQTRPHLEEPTTIVYADIRTSHIQLPVEDTKPDVTESTGKRAKCGFITKILNILIILALSCALAVSIYKLITKEDKSETKDKLLEITKQICVNIDKRQAECTVCPNGWLWHRENCYYFSSDGEYRTWKESRELCEEMGADLLVIEDREQQEFINRSITQHTDGKFWIGLYRDGDGWRWVDGHLYNTGLFQISVSSGDCVWQEAESGYNRDRCQSKHRWICQKRSLKI